MLICLTEPAARGMFKHNEAKYDLDTLIFKKSHKLLIEIVMLVNECFSGFRIRSFFLEKELICHNLVLFFRASSSGWISLVIDEGIATFSQECTEPPLLDLSEICDGFAYPVRVATELSCYEGKEIKSIYEYRIKEIEEGCVGIYFECEKGGFTVLEVDGCLSISHGVHENLQEEISLENIK